MSEMSLATSDSVRFNLDDARAAGEQWGFNCGPAALCAVLGKTPDEIRPDLGEFESKGFMNPTLMANTLRGLHVPICRVFESARQPEPSTIKWPGLGLVRIQWAGPWTEPNRPMVARYRHTHWIASRGSVNTGHEVFDVNAMCAGGWMSFAEWSEELVPWLLKQVAPKATGEWWPTHCWEIGRER